MNSQDKNWYIEYDYKTLNLIQNHKFSISIFKEVELFVGLEGPILKEEQEQTNISKWVSQTAQAITEILILLYNFYNVEYKLSKNQEVKTRFMAICSVLKIENEYAKYFYAMSQQFRINRVLACTLRLNKFLGCIVDELFSLRKHMDQTLLDNLQEVELFMQQRLMQILEITKSEGDSDINILLLEGLSLILRMSGDTTMKGIIDINKEKQIIDKILKSNQVYDEFMKKKEIAKSNFEQNKYFQKEMPVEEDPNAKRSPSEKQEEQDNFD